MGMRRKKLTSVLSVQYEKSWSQDCKIASDKKVKSYKFALPAFIDVKASSP